MSYSRYMMLCTSVVSILSVSACGTDTKDRTLGGAALGAGVGGVGAAVLHANPITGAAIGAGVGAVTGAATRPDQVNMGKPVWKKDK